MNGRQEQATEHSHAAHFGRACKTQRGGAFRLAQAALCSVTALATVAATQFDDIAANWHKHQAHQAQQQALTPILNNPLHYADYQEDATRRVIAPLSVDPNVNRRVTNDISTTRLEDNQRTLLRNRLELDQAIATCAQRSADCAPGIAEYSSMIRAAGQLPDRLTQAGFVNAWVNTAIRYDRVEAKANWRRTLTEALADGQGVCDEQSQLKFHALDRIGFPAQDTRIIFAALTQGGQRTGAHAFVLTRMDETNWVLDNQQLPIPTDTSAQQQRRILGIHAQMLPDTRHANTVGAPLPGIGDRSVFPRQAHTYLTAAPYAGIVEADKEPFFVGKRLSLRRRSTGIATDFDLNQALDAAAAPVRTQASAALQTALLPHRSVAKVQTQPLLANQR
jgi:predicted transglutaminase-like cysteine proteinase